MVRLIDSICDGVEKLHGKMVPFSHLGVCAASAFKQRILMSVKSGHGRLTGLESSSGTKLCRMLLTWLCDVNLAIVVEDTQSERSITGNMSSL